MRKVPDHLWIIKITYVTVASECTAKSLTFHRLELIFDPTTSSLPSSHQHLTESDKILVNFALTINTAMFGLWAIKITELTARAKNFRKVPS